MRNRYLLLTHSICYNYDLNSQCKPPPVYTVVMVYGSYTLGYYCHIPRASCIHGYKRENAQLVQTIQTIPSKNCCWGSRVRYYCCLCSRSFTISLDRPPLSEQQKRALAIVAVCCSPTLWTNKFAIWQLIQGKTQHNASLALNQILRAEAEVSLLANSAA